MTKIDKIKIALVLTLTTLGIGGALGAITYAGFAASKVLPSTVGTNGTTKAIFLTSDENIEKHNALIFCRVWKTRENGIWIQANSEKINGHFVFRIPYVANSNDNYNNILFARVDPTYKTNPEFSMQTSSGEGTVEIRGIWNQTNDLTISDSNYFHITGYSDATLVGLWQSFYNPYSS